MTCRSCGRGPLVSTRVRPWTALTHEGRGLCSACYKRHTRAGTLLDWPRLTWSGVELVADAELIRRRDGRTWASVAEALGVTPGALERARLRVARMADR